MHTDILDAPTPPVQEPLVYTRERDRLIASIIDFILLTGISFIVPRIAIHFTYRHEVALTIITGLQMIYYLFIVKKYGGTPGKLLLNMKILTTHGQVLTWYHVGMRYLPLFIIQAFSLTGVLFWEEISFFLEGKPVILSTVWSLLTRILTVTWVLASIVMILTNEKRLSFNDRIAGTVVVVSKKIKPKRQ